MSEHKHTPGPWEYIDARASARYKYAPECVIRGGKKQIASFGWGDSIYWPTQSESQANARLIAAAPELLEALQMYFLVVGNTGYALSRESASELYDKASAAIAKATGEQP